VIFNFDYKLITNEENHFRLKILKQLYSHPQLKIPVYWFL